MRRASGRGEDLADHAAVVTGDGDHGRAGRRVAAVGEMAVSLFLAGVLDAHEHGLPVRAPLDARNLALSRTHHEAADIARHRVAHEHLVVALARKALRVRVFPVGLNPQHAVSVEREAVGRVEHVIGRDVSGARVRALVDDGIARDHVEVPREGRREVVAPVRRPAHDLPVVVVRPGVRPADGRGVAALVGLLAPVLVVGETAEDFRLLGVRRHPLGAVHGGGRNGRGRDARVDAYFRLGGHAGGFGRKLHPLAPAALGELRREEFSAL